MKILITGSAGFIGFHLSKKLSLENFEIFGIDNINKYYDDKLKISRLNELGFETKSIAHNQILTSKIFSNLKFLKLDINDFENLNKVFNDESFDFVFHLAAQAGVRYSIENPDCYIESNINGFFNILKLSNEYNVKNFYYASSSSVYGNELPVPFSVNQNVDKPASLYAATKKSNELFAHVYSDIFGLSTTGLRFFTVYGPWGRPDMAYFDFAKKILNNETINVYNNGNLSRDFTFVDDIIESLYRLLKLSIKTLNQKHDGSKAYRVFNIGNGSPVSLIDFIETLERKLDQKAIKHFVPMQSGDVHITFADTIELYNLIDFRPATSLSEGLEKFVTWYLNYYKKN